MKGKSKLLLLITIILVTISGLAGCSTGSDDTGFFTTYFVNPFTAAIHFLGELFAGNYGLAIIVVTLLIRLALMPLMLKQYKNQLEMKGKMEKMKPEIDELQRKIKAEKDSAKQKELQMQMMGIYQKHGVNPMSMGCLPILIQMPILTGFYYAIRNSPEIASHDFLWLSLGSPDIAITALAGIVYYLQFKVSQSTMTAEQQKQMKVMGLMSPIMIVMFSMNAPAALPLYWAVGGTFLIIQSWISRKLYQKTETTKVAPSIQK
ncbi:OxaA precursor [Bacillus sp. FJAT-27225]|uniref:membrane protein insertase YidC n=1 Tax=Bacillus sp. FJAT-27225 TaxID=1743144 RepID=UPI00080C2959|nr:membrane protein insertase YidC [Bacillus sp. FJAT-27225]OCA90786.1 OxaA precursor [Bacillus sp. FJAT-27225]